MLLVARTLAAHGDADDEELSAALQQAGLDALDAELALVFVPLAFGRVAFERMGSVPTFAPAYEVKARDGTTVARPIAAEPWYRAAAEVARTHLADAARATARPDRLTQEEFKAALRRSPEVAAAGELLQDGGEPADLVFVEPFLMRVPAEALTTPLAAPRATARTTARATPRPWWRFW